MSDAALLAPYVSRTVAGWVEQEPGQRALEIDGSLVCADISGFTRLSEALAALGRAGAEELTDLLNGCFSAMIATCDTLGGDVLKFGGDALLVLFSGAAHAVRACRAAAGIRADIARPRARRNGQRVRLAISIGIASGPVTLFLVDAGHTELLVAGPVASAAGRAEGEATAGQILAVPATAEQIPRTWLGRQAVNGRLLRGLPGPESAQNAGPAPTVALDLAALDLAALPADDLAALVPEAQREHILAGIVGEHRAATVAFVELLDVDAFLAGSGVAATAERTQALASVVAASCRRQGVHWLGSDVYPGALKVILAAGAPTSQGDDEDRMLRALREIVDEAGTDLAVGVNSGEVFAGNLGSVSRRTYTVMGDTVNLAARLMQRAERCQLIASNRMLAGVRDRFDLTPLDPFTVKGKQAPVQASLVGRWHGRPRSVAASDLAFVGRTAELSLMLDAVHARAPRGVLLDVAGDPGVGKSRLVAEFLKRLGDLPTVSAHCQPYHTSTPYGSARTLLRSVAGIELEASPEEAGVALAAWVDQVAPGLRPWLPLVAIPADAVATPTPASAAIAEQFRAERTHRAVGDLLEAAFPTRAVARIEDVQWMDDASRSLLDSLARRLGRLPWIVVSTRRATGLPLGGTDFRDRCTIDLSPLTASEGLALARALTADLPEDWRATIAERAEGNPVFIMELAAAARTGGVTALPPSVEAALTARIDALPGPDRLLVRDASVLGVQVELDLLGASLGQDAAGLSRWAALDSVADVLDGRRAVRFRHTLLQEVAYEGLSFRRRRRVHALVGEALERGAGAAVHDRTALASLHFCRAEAWERCWACSLSAGAAARAVNAVGEALTFYDRALESAAHLPGLDPVAWSAAAEAHADLHELSAHYAESARSYALARHLAAGDCLATGRLWRKTGVLAERAGRYPLALRWYGQSLRVLDTGGPGGGNANGGEVLETLLAYAGVRYRQGRYRDCLALARRAADAGRRAGEQAHLAHALYLQGVAQTYFGDKAAAVAAEQEALDLYEQLGDHLGQGNVLNNLGIAAYFDGRWNDALELYERSRAARRRAGDVLGEAVQAMNIGEVLSDQGHLDAALSMLEEARAAFEAASYPIGVGIACSDLGRATARAGRPTDALPILSRAVAMLDEIGATAHALEAETRSLECLLQLGRFAQATALADDLAARLEGREGDEPLRVAVTRGRAWVALRRGDPDRAGALADEARQRALALGVPFDEALALQVAVELEGSHGAAAGRLAAILEQLGVVHLQPVPALTAVD